jgi:hypothetical protein
MEFLTPVYELLYFYQERGVRFPPYWDLMREQDILELISKGIGEKRGRK